MCQTLDDHKSSVYIRGRLITNFRFTDDIFVNAKEEETDALVDRLDTTTTRNKMEIGPEKTKVEPKWLPKGSVISNKDPNPRFSPARQQQLFLDWRSFIASNVKQADAVAHFFCHHFACESLTLTAELERQIQAREMRWAATWQNQ